MSKRASRKSTSFSILSAGVETQILILLGLARPGSNRVEAVPGAKIGVLGLNGSGKSTLLKIMAGVDTEFNGEARPMPELAPLTKAMPSLGLAR